MLRQQSHLPELPVQLPAPALPAKGVLPEDAGRLGHLRATPPSRLAVGLAKNTAAPSSSIEKGNRTLPLQPPAHVEYSIPFQIK